MGRLQRVLGLAFGVAVAVGGTIGVGILRRPGTVAELLPNEWAIYGIWVAGGVYAMLGALCVAELATMMPRAGGFFVYAERAFGPGAGFAIGWCDWLANAAAVAYGAMAAAGLIARFAPWMSAYDRAVALALACTFCALQCLGVRASSRLQKILSLLVCIAFAALVTGCFAMPALPARTAAVPFSIGVWVLGFRAVMVSYDGWYEPAYFAEESVDPGRTVPKSLIFGVVLVTSIYLLVNAGLVHVLSLANLRGAELPVADAARRIAGPGAGTLVAALSLLAVLPMTNTSLLGGARIFYGLGRDFLTWRDSTRVSDNGSPWVATILTAGFAAALIATGTFDAVLAMAGVFMIILYCSAYASLIALRLREPDAARPYRLKVYPWVPALLLATGTAFFVAVTISDPRATAAALGAIAVSYPVRMLLVRRSARQSPWATAPEE
jgi:APA family basic amino acid/polyamine antiporter